MAPIIERKQRPVAVQVTEEFRSQMDKAYPFYP